MDFGLTAGIIAASYALVVAVIMEPLITSHGQTVYLAISVAGSLVTGIVVGLFFNTNVIAVAIAFTMAGLIVPYVYMVWQGKIIKDTGRWR